MRTGVDGGTFGYYNSQQFETWERIKVANGSGTMVDVSMRFTGYNWQPPQPNLPIGALTVDFARDASPSLAPFVVASTLNRLNDGTTYSPLLQIGRTVTMEIAIGQQGSGPAGRPADGSSLWYEVFRGTISNVKWPQFGSHVASITVLDLGGVLQKMKSQAEYTYTAGTAIETVAQQILTNNGATWVSFSCPVATGKVLPNDVKPGLQKTVWEQLATLFRQAGMVLWWRYTGTGTLQLVAFEPSRNKTIVDQSFSIVTDYTQLEIDENDIGSTGYIVYYDSDGVQQTIGPMQDSASIAKYGGQYAMQRPFWIVLTADSPVRDGTSALNLLTQALSDVADPDVVATVTMPPLWFGEAAVDLYQFPTITGWLFDSPLEAAPFAITVQRQGDQQPYASVSVRGKPSAGRKTWQLVGGGQIITSYGLNGSNLILADTIDSFQLGPTLPYVSAGGATDAWPRRPFTVNTESDLTTWSLGGLFMERCGNVASFGPQGLENYLRFENTNTISGPNLGIISNAEMIGPGGTVVGWKNFAGGFVMNANLATVSGKVITYDAGGVSRVTGATGVFSGQVIGFRGAIPATHAAVTGELWNLYMDGTAPNYLAARLYFGSATGSAYLEGTGGTNLWSGATLSTAAYQVSGTTVIDSARALVNVTMSASLLTSGTIPDARLSSNVALQNGNVAFTGTFGVGAGSGGAGIGFHLLKTTATDAVQYGLFLRHTSSTAATSAGRALYARSDVPNSVFTQTANVGAYIANPVKGASATITTAYGIDVESITSGTTNYSIRTGTAQSLFGGDVRVDGNLTLKGAALGGGVGVFGLLDATTAPTSTPAGGSVLWSTGGVLKTRSAFDALGGFYVNGVQTVLPTGILAPGSVANAAAFAANLKPVEVWTYATLPASPAANTIAFVTDWPLGGGPTGPRMARWSGSAWVALAAADQIVGQLTAGSIAAGAVSASAISVSALSAINANLGTVTAGIAQNAAGTRWLDLGGTTSDFLHHDKLALTHAGGAIFTGTTRLNTSGANTLELWDGASQVASISTVAMGIVGAGSDPFSGMMVAFNGYTGQLGISPRFGSVSLENIDSSGNVAASLVLNATTKITATTRVIIGEAATGLGYFGSNGTTKQTVTGAKGGNVALTNLLIALAAHGMIVNSTT